MNCDPIRVQDGVIVRDCVNTALMMEEIFGTPAEYSLGYSHGVHSANGSDRQNVVLGSIEDLALNRKRKRFSDFIVGKEDSNENE